MKKWLVSSAVVAGVLALGGGYYLEADHQSSRSQVSETQSVVSKTKAKKQASSSATTTKKSTATKASATSSSKAPSQSTTSASSASQDNNNQVSSQQPISSNQSSSTTVADQSTTSQPATETSRTSVATRQLTASQINDWAWQQVAATYQNTTVNKQDFAFNQYRNGGLVYVEVYENQNADVAHLAGRFRVNAQGQLEQQQLAKGDVWQVVSSQP